MIDFKISPNKSVSSDDISAVIFPCSSFEMHQLWLELPKHKIKRTDLIEPQIGISLDIDWVTFLNQKLPISVTLWCWQIKGVKICLVEPSGNVFVRSIVEEWLERHFKCRYDNNSRRAFFDPYNFHNCVHVIEEKSMPKFVAAS